MNKLLLFIVLLACIFAPLQSCAGPRVQSSALFQPARLAWPAVNVDYLRGIEDGLVDGDLAQATADALRASGNDMRSALKEEDRAALLLVPWLQMEPWAERGIDTKVHAGEIGLGVAKSLREQVKNFTITINRLRGI